MRKERSKFIGCPKFLYVINPNKIMKIYRWQICYFRTFLTEHKWFAGKLVSKQIFGFQFTMTLYNGDYKIDFIIGNISHINCICPIHWNPCHMKLLFDNYWFCYLWVYFLLSVLIMDGSRYVVQICLLSVIR